MTMLTKGMWVRAVVPRTQQVSLAGVQVKMGMRYEEIAGIVTEIRGDKPVDPTTVGVWIQPEGNQKAVAVRLEAIVEAKTVDT